jgi:NADPH-dependent 2,4-dienoyl-CoA reductase/sulfur reductase-like enzyme/peroxiredoxin family protein/TusA-related sulfurtransferase/rhodanese-related sulfurtransferase
MRVIIVGGGAAGASCAARLRRLNEDAEIIIIEKTNEVSIANCGLPYYVSGVINEREKILVSTPEKFKSWFNIDVLLDTEVINIMPDEKKVFLSNGEEMNYDKLVLAQGASPIVPPFEGMDKDKTFIVRNLNDADKIKNYIQQNNSKKAVVVGGGFIGIEMAENLTEMGLDTTLVELGNQILAPVDEEIASVAQNEMRDNGVNLILSDGVKSFDDNNIILNSGKVIEFDIVIMAIGVRPETALAKVAGLEVNRGILVDEYMQTSNADIYAAGDSVEVKDFVTGDNALIPLAGPANRQGRIIADNICGVNEKLSTYKNSQGTSVLKVFGLTVASVGNNEKQLKQKEIPYWKTFVYGHSHAGYYPDSTQTLYKLLFSPDGKILGAQAVGQEGVEKRIDVISSVMRNSGTVQELIDSELCYAPPYNSAKDSGVNVLGMSADNILKGLVKPAYFEDLEGSYLIDVRANIAYKTKTIEGAINIPISEIRSRLNEIPTDKKVVLFCNTGYTSYNASRILIQKGFNNVYSLMGGITLYKEIIKNKEGKVASKTPVAVGGGYSQNSEVIKIDACGLQCPGPIMKVSNALNNANNGDIFEVTSTDRGFKSDIGAWCESTGNTLLDLKQDKTKIIATISKGSEVNMENKVINNGNGQTIVVFSNDLDKALASFIIANGAKASGKDVTMFFTFWGLNILRKSNVSVKKGFIDKMFGFMMPKGAEKLTLSKMNMGGMGSAMMKWVMKNKNISTLSELIQQAQDSGVKFIACNMSMDVMGIKEEELIDGVEISGVAKYISESNNANSNLFI